MTDPWHAMGPFPGRVLPPEYDDKPVPVSVGYIDTTAPERSNSVAEVIKAAEAQPDTTPVKVKVQKPYRVIHKGKPYCGGAALAVAPDIAEHWIKNKWAAPVVTRKENNGV